MRVDRPPVFMTILDQADLGDRRRDPAVADAFASSAADHRPPAQVAQAAGMGDRIM
jgi:hypothetical protein